MGTPGTQRFGKYEILSQLGKGGMAEVFRARVLSGPREGWLVAIKRLLPELAADPEYVDLFTSEADLCKFLDHPNIVKVLEVGVADGIYFIAMELVDGRDLSQILRRCKQRGIHLPVDFAVHLTRVLLESLAYAHDARGPTGAPLGIVHCDVSPSNLFISRLGEVKLGDFGIARAASGGAGTALLGKPYYQSPEVLDGQVTPAVDIWAAGIVLYELLTLERPFQGKTPDEVFAAVRERRYVPLRTRRPQASEELESVLQRAFARDAAARFASAGDFAQALVPLYDPAVGTDLGIAAVVRGLFGATADG